MTARIEASIVSGVLDEESASELLAEIEGERGAEQARFSFAGRIGSFIEPVIKPLGFDWRMGVALLSGFMAKEVVVSTMGTIYGVGEADETSESLRRSLATDPGYSQLSAYAFLVFVLLYMPCMSAMAVFARESGSIKEVWYQLGYTFSLAWGASFIVYQGGKLLGLG
jgi:ferrous iron transport protein B